ncbi:MAG: hypothetical protein ABSB39_14685 [Candidatus Sulfotelmatobacter sp.]|jgi:hypothetical protein
MNITFDTGKQITVPTKTKDAMLATLENPQASPARKELAKGLLEWYASEVAKPPLTGKSELDRGAQLMVIEFHADLLWTGSHRLEKRSVNGIESLVICDAKTGEAINSYQA